MDARLAEIENSVKKVQKQNERIEKKLDKLLALIEE